ncbi:hypothetical protein GALL_503270 [mine drainage metagenome]|uniref:Uncharacterized protein n=1 Tax=mine drainage metagenome TaxID=410659 RepID=A0A1J5PWT6_9ZZZZ
MGMGFWSKLDAVGQPSACTFESAEQARQHMQSWDNGQPPGVRFVEVIPDDGTYASMHACVRAGLPAWLTVDTETSNAASMPI